MNREEDEWDSTKYNVIVFLIALLIIFLVGFSIYYVSYLEPKKEAAAIVIIEGYASEACTTLEKFIGSEKNVCSVVVVPFQGDRTPDVKEKVSYNSYANAGERYFEDCLVQNMIESKKIRLVTRSKLEKAVKELKIQMTDLIDPDTAKKIGKFIAADCIILIDGYIGRKIDGYKGDGWFRVKVEAVDVEKAEIIGGWKNQYVREPE